MKHAIISYPNSINIGDEIQSVAAAELLPKVDYYLDRENLHNANLQEKVKLICNGWFMGSPRNWPPENNIDPLFISFHITKSNKSHKLLANSKLIDYYKQHEPIGCRDLGTMKLFNKIGVKAYYSGCLTLTLKNKFTERGENIVLADPLRSNYNKAYRNYIIDQLVPKKYHDQIITTEHHNYNRNRTLEERFKEAENLIEIYSKAKLVLTSRIHVALPCLALGTPVYFIHAGYHSAMFNLNDRFDGMLEYFKIIDEQYFPNSGSGIFKKAMRIIGTYKGNKIKQLPINWEQPEPNHYDIEPIAENLRKTVQNFINK